MATVTLTFTDQPDGVGYDVRGEFDPPLKVNDVPTAAQDAVLQITDTLAKVAVGDITVTSPDSVKRVL